MSVFPRFAQRGGFHSLACWIGCQATGELARLRKTTKLQSGNEVWLVLSVREE